MSEPGRTPETPQVGVYALIGRDERLLLIEQSEHDALPGGRVHAGEPIENALGRTLLDQLGATIAAFDFCTVVEHGATKPGQPPVSEVTFLFDVTLTDHDHLDESASCPHRWAGEHELSNLQPQVIRDALIAGTLSAENPWRAWTP